MSIGNLNTQGDKKNNFPYQRRVLGLLQHIFTVLSLAPAPTQLTHTIASTSGGGTIPAGTKSVSFVNVGSAAGTIEGVTIPVGITVTWDAGDDGDTLKLINYSAAGTTFLITTLT